MKAIPGIGRLWLEWWLIALVSTALALFLVADRAPAEFNNLIYDSLLRLMERQPAPGPLIVASDNRSMREIGPRPSSRDDQALGQAAAESNVVPVPLMRDVAGRQIRPVEGMSLAVISLLFLWILLIGFRLLRPRENLLLLAFLLAMLPIVAAILLWFGLWLPPAVAMIAIVLAYPLWSWRRLSAISTSMTGELEQFQAEPDLLPRRQYPPWKAKDAAERQSLLFHVAMERMRDMQRFASDRLLQLPDATLVTDREGKVLSMNVEAGRLMEALGATPADRENLQDLLALLHRADDRRADGEFSALPLETEERIAANDGEIISADGRYFDLRIVPQLAMDESLVGWVVRMVDITEARILQRQREQILELLSHDMRAPQASIIAMLDNAAPGQIAGDTARRIEAYARRTLTLADDFVQFMRAEAPNYIMEELILTDLLMDAADELWPQSSARKIAVDVHGPDELLIRGERSLLTRTFINLLGNAIKYSPEESRITCHLSRGTEEKTGLAICTIADKGIGIAPSHLEHLSERFHHAPSLADRRIDNVGLGLVFAHAVISRHGGTIRCESIVGKGSTFTIELPVAP